ncbi:Chemotaxis protein methyltransferase Cher2 [Planctomycetes bacterium Poly30]|uniref:protein-glutamate O-methyltransferase n=1 Tax=Saltatorellus ferox TaxID=2528018 RepID=A0A518EKA8_9BACT|nr:Chemotaxis protein methyltransferase Cher2 [Planctomycetes bacterium Poly30]
MNRLQDGDLDLLSAFAHRKWGLSIDAKKRVIVENRIHSLQRDYPIESVKSLVKDIERGQAQALELALFDVLSTNHTSFFREDVHYDLIVNDILKPARRRSKGLRIWSAGCSRGCEPYTLSILLQEILEKPKMRDDRILATDLSTGALAAARLGVYTQQEVHGVTPARLRTFFQEVDHRGSKGYQIAPRLRDIVSFNMLNLLDPWPMKGPFDVVLCRNVMIYFDTPTRKALAQRFLKLLRPGGLFFVGTSESLNGYALDVEQLMVGAYRKPGGIA